MWADHGDEVSNQYAGTVAMKSAFTRTGKRDIWGLLDDGAKSLTRWVACVVMWVACVVMWVVCCGWGWVGMGPGMGMG